MSQGPNWNRYPVLFFASGTVKSAHVCHELHRSLTGSTLRKSECAAQALDVNYTATHASHESRDRFWVADGCSADSQSMLDFMLDAVSDPVSHEAPTVVPTVDMHVKGDPVIQTDTETQW